MKHLIQYHIARRLGETTPPPAPPSMEMNEISSSPDDTLLTDSPMEAPEIAVPELTEKPMKQLGRWKLIVLVLPLFGLQIVWTVQTAFGTPYLLQMGIPPHWTSVVWAAGPISGLIVQPWIGVTSDSYNGKFGRRKPFLLLGTGLTGMPLMLLAVSPRLLSSTLIGWVAVFCFYMLDFSLNVLQSVSRALIIDVASSQMKSANSLASTFINVGNLVGYAVGSIDFGDDQVPVLCMIAATLLLFCVSITCIVITEEQRVHPMSSDNFLKTFYKAWLQLDPFVTAICRIQFFSWLGWFSILFYGSSFIAALIPAEGSDMTSRARLGSTAFFFFSAVSSFVSLLLPHVTRSLGSQNTWRLPFGKVWATGHCTFFVSCSILTWFVRDVRSGLFLFVLLGYPWAVTLFVPFTAIGQWSNESTDVGTTLGILNVYVVVPQLIFSMLATLIFAVDGSFALLLQLSGLGSLVAAVLSLQLPG
jgi:solute carrier family 45 protein 1/2/4